MAKTVAIASDHGGYKLKRIIRMYLEENNIPIVDFGTDSADSCDYADFAEKACQSVINGVCHRAILFCGTGVGISIAANKISGIRACCCSDLYSAEMTRKHNDANVLCMGGRVVGEGIAEKLVETFLKTEFEGGRHQLRIDKISALENRKLRMEVNSND